MKLHKLNYDRLDEGGQIGREDVPVEAVIAHGIIDQRHERRWRTSPVYVRPLDFQ